MNAALSWDEFRLVKAIADSRSLTGAAEALGLNHSTVFRRLAALEAAVGSHLFERSRSGYEPTTAGDEMIALASVMADSIVEFERRIAGRDFKPVGCLRVTTSDLIAHHFLPAVLPQFRAQYPGMVLELILCHQLLNLSRRDADVAIRLTNDPPETLVGRRICAVRWRLYCGRGFKPSPGPQDEESMPFIGYCEGFGPPLTRRWIETHVRPERIAATVNSLQIMHQLAAHNFGVALLPCFVGDASPDLVGLGQPMPELDVGLWILTHSDLRRSARVRAFMDYAALELAKHKRAIEAVVGDEIAGTAGAPLA